MVGTPNSLVKQGNELHHRHGADGNDLIDPSLLQEFLEHFGHEALAAVAAIVGADVQFMGSKAHLVFEDEQTLVAGPDDGRHVATGFLHAPGDGMQHRHARSAANADHVLATLDVRGLTQGADDVLVGVANLQARKKLRALADHHVDDRDCPLDRVGFGHGQRYPLALLVGLQNEKLPRTGLGGDARRLYLVQDDRAAGHLLPPDYLEHMCLPLHA
jgi:hypothetical protein